MAVEWGENALTEEQAIFVALRSLAPSTWIHRRVERIEYVDKMTARRRISIDFTVPLNWPEGGKQGTLIPLPLAQFDKQPLTHFDFVDQAGEPIPMLTREENSEISSSVLLAIAQLATDDQLDGTVIRWVPVLTRSSDPRDLEMAASLILGRNTKVGAELHSFGAFRFLAQELATSFMLYLPVDSSRAGQRVIVKLAFEHGEGATPRPSRWRERFGLVPVRHAFRVPGAGMSASHHVEIEAPREMRIDSGVFSATSNGRTISHRSRRTTETLHLALQGIDRGSDAEVEITISARPEVLAGTTLFSALIALTLLFVRLRLKHFHLDQSFDAIVGVVLALPGIALAYISRPAEHPIASTFLFFLRGIALAPVVASFIAAIVLFAGYSLGVLDWVYTVLTVGAFLAVVVLLAALVGPWLRRWPAGVTNER